MTFPRPSSVGDFSGCRCPFESWLNGVDCQMTLCPSWRSRDRAVSWQGERNAFRQTGVPISAGLSVLTLPDKAPTRMVVTTSVHSYRLEDSVSKNVWASSQWKLLARCLHDVSQEMVAFEGVFFCMVVTISNPQPQTRRHTRCLGAVNKEMVPIIEIITLVPKFPNILGVWDVEKS